MKKKRERGGARLPGTLFAAALVVAASLVAYAPSFGVPFTFDDVHIIDNPDLHDVRDPAAVLAYYPSRPLPMLSFALNYTLAGVHPLSWHVVNFALHALASVALLLLVRKVFETPALSGRVDEALRTPVAACAAVVFAVHPLATEAVTYIWQRMEIMAWLFSALALLAWLAARLRVEEGSLTAAGRRRPTRGLLVLAALAAACAVGSKETAVALPALAILIEIVLFPASCVSRPRRARMIAPFVALALVPPAVIFATGKAWNQTPWAEMEQRASFTPLTYFATEMGVHMRYVRLLFVPAGLNLDYDVAPVASLADPRALAAMLALSAAGVAAVALMRRAPILSLAVLWYFLAMGPSSSFMPLEDLMFEHRLYPALAVPGLLAGAVLLLLKLRRRAIITVTVVIAAVFVPMTFARDVVWRSSEPLWRDAVAKSPRKARPAYNLACALRDKGRTEDALAYFERAAALEPDTAVFLAGLGSVYGRLGRYPQALARFKRAKELAPDDARVWTGLGAVLSATGDSEAARGALERALALAPRSADAHGNMGSLLHKTGAHEEAFTHYDLAICYGPHRADIANSYGLALRRTGAIARAAGMFERAVSLKPSWAEPRANLGECRLASGDPAAAQRLLLEALELDGAHVGACYNLLVCYRKRGDVEQMKRHAKRFLDLAPRHPRAAAIRAELDRMAR